MARECNKKSDCPQGKNCVNGFCTDDKGGTTGPSGGPVYTCAGKGDQACPQGQTCQNGVCVATASPAPTPAPTPTPTPTPTPPPSPGEGPSGPPPNMADNCKYVCGDAAIAAEHARVDAKQAQSQADQAQFQTAQNQWQTTLAGQNAAIAQHLPHYQPPRAPSQPGGYSPGQYQVSTMPLGGTTQASPSGNQTPPPTPAAASTPAPTSWQGALGSIPGTTPGASPAPALPTTANGTTPASVSPYAPGAGFTSWQDYVKQSGQG